MVGNDRRGEKSRKLESAVAIGSDHHGHLDVLVAQSGDASSPLSFDRAPTFELEAELAKEVNRRRKVLDDDSYVVHPFDRHVSNLQTVAPVHNGNAVPLTISNG